MESDQTLWEESPKILLAKEVINILTQAMSKIDDNDLFSAQVMVGIALHHLESLQVDLTEHLSWEKMLRDVIKHS
ncbi:MAG: hypothetical protein NW224_24660 [Leptolyngbyaceae cyanobacterium bins.302]|nr:hypothetical protein [Leptolyngbyaceae cyanobacterium bins.302]